MNHNCQPHSELDPAGDQWEATDAVVAEALVARNRLVEANLGLVRSIANRFSRKVGVDFDDLVQAGSVGLMRAAEKFDPDRGFRFSTYASRWIEQAISRAAPQGLPGPSIPEYRRLEIYHLNQAETSLERELCRPPTAIELADRLGITSEALQQRQLFRARLRVDYLEDLLSPGAAGPLLDDSDPPRRRFLWDLAATQTTPLPEEVVLAEEQRQTIQRALDRLSDRQRHLIKRRFGLDGQPPASSLRSLEDSLSISSGVARRAIKRGLSQLAQDPDIQDLSGHRQGQ